MQKEYAFSVKKTKTKNQSHGSKRTSSTSIFDDVVSEIISTEQGQMGDSSSGKCFHEDGGKFAIFGKTDEVLQK